MAQKKGFSPMKKLSFEKIWNDLGEVLTEGSVIFTLSRNQANHITRFTEEGIEVLTRRSSPKSRLVPRWMLERAIEYLLEHGNLSNHTLLNELNVKRSSFVMAALSQLDYIEYLTQPMRIFLKY